MTVPTPPRRIDLLVLHCTATQPHTPVAAIQRYWREQLHWRQPGYHYLVEAGGTVHALQPHQFPANGVRGHNAHSLHLSYVGGIDRQGRPADTRTPAQLRALETLVKTLLRMYPQAQVAGHYQLAAKACPSFDVPAWLRHVGVPDAHILDNQTPAPVPCAVC